MEKLSGILESKHEGFFIIITETFIGKKTLLAKKYFIRDTRTLSGQQFSFARDF